MAKTSFATQQYLNQALNPIVDLSQRIAVPFTSIQNRAQIVDPSKDLEVQFGVKRIPISRIEPLQSEFGANGERVFKLVDDVADQIRFVGSWSNATSNNGTRPVPATLGDYVEITFYGTGLNVQTLVTTTATDLRASVDGGAEGGNVGWAVSSAVLADRNYNPNQIIPIVSGLSPAVHTVRIRVNTASGGTFGVYGFEILCEQSALVAKQGSILAGSSKLSLAANQSVSFNSGFESGTLGSRGGRVVTYLKSDGTIGKAVQPVNTTQQDFNAADHTNEEIVRTYHPREFGAGRSDDFSIGDAVTTRTFTLEDGVTTLTASNGTGGNFGVLSGIEMVRPGTGTGLTFTFVGTGLDVLWKSDSNSGTNSSANAHTFSINGGTAINFPNVAVANPVVQRIVSGLPYGTHTVRFVRNSPDVWSLFIGSLIVYGPKKPSIPTGAVELADYNVMADFVANTVADDVSISRGVIRKTANREFVYVQGTGGSSNWSTNYGPNPGAPNFVNLVNDGLNSYFEYTFFGTGFDFRFGGGGGASSNVTCTLNGIALNASYPSAGSINCSVLGTGVTYGGQGPNTSFLLSAVASNSLVQTTTGTINGFRVSNLPLARYTVRFNQSAAAGNVLRVSVLDIITPIHAPSRGRFFEQQNTLPVGSLAVSDSRKLSLDVGSDRKFVGSALGVTSNPSTTSTTPIPMPEMSLSIPSKGGWFKLSAGFRWRNTAAGGSAVITQFYVNGSSASITYESDLTTANNGTFTTVNANVYLPPGVHKIDLYWSTAAGTLTGLSTSRNLIVEEL